MDKEKYMVIPIDEQETTISFSRSEQELKIWTNDRTVMTKLDKLCKFNPERYTIAETGRNANGEVMDKQYIVSDKTLLSFLPKKRVVKLTDEQKAERAERLRQMRASS